MAQKIVEISDLKIAAPPDTLITYALGSCVGICLYDPAIRLGGLAHIMLPNFSVSPRDKNIYKFADTAIPEMIRQLERTGARRSRLQAKIAGGAQMFEPHGGDPHGTWQIGQRNVSAVIQTLQEQSIPLLAQDVLKNYGRTVLFDPQSGIMTVKALNKTIVRL